MDKEKLIELLNNPKEEHAEIIVTCSNYDVTISDVDHIKQYIMALNERLSNAGNGILWFSLFVYFCLIVFTNSPLSNNYEQLHFLRGWFFGVTAFIVIFVMQMSIANILIKRKAKKLALEFGSKANDLGFTTEQLLNTDWLESKATMVKSMISCDIFDA